MDDAAKLRLISRLFFSGPLGRFSARTMEKRNADAEIEAVATLDPDPTDHVLAIGFGPGVGVRKLAERLPEGQVGGIDPSGFMVRRAARRARAAAGRVRLECAYTNHIPWPDATFDGAIAVNSVQFWNPLSDNVAEVARVLKPGARLVTITHDWALARAAGTAADWLDAAKRTFTETGFQAPETWTADSEGGHAITLCATRTS